MNHAHLRRLFRSVLAALGLLILWLPLSSQAAGSVVRTVSGEVEAVNVAVTPPIIVVKVRLPSREEMIVGATVAADVPVTRGKKRASLAEIKSGDHVRITYEKHAEGISAKAIHTP